MAMGADVDADMHAQRPMGADADASISDIGIGIGLHVPGAAGPAAVHPARAAAKEVAKQVKWSNVGIKLQIAAASKATGR